MGKPASLATLPKVPKVKRKVWNVQTFKEAIKLVDDDLLLLCMHLAFACSLRAVSYTHLDVYKRQIWDRLVQQCILQVLEPICEPKFHNHSYGFRANRSAHHAVSRVTTLINLSKYHYCVDVDIKGFFDNVNHGKLLKQIWTLGIRDKRLICIISKMLKAEIDGEGVPEKGRCV